MISTYSLGIEIYMIFLKKIHKKLKKSLESIIVLVMSINSKDLKIVVDIIGSDPDLSTKEKMELLLSIEKQANIPEDIVNRVLDEYIVEEYVKTFKYNKKKVENTYHRQYKCYENNPYNSEPTRYRLRRKLNEQQKKVDSLNSV